MTKQDKVLIKSDKVACIPNFLEEAEMLDWAGINFGQLDGYQLQHSMKVRTIFH